MRKLLAVVIVAGVISGAGWAWSAYRSGNSRSISVRQEELSADDLARVRRQHIIKLNLSLPQDNYTVNLWMEEWKKGETSPTIHMLATMGPWPTAGETLLFSVPTDRDSEWFFGLNNASTSGRIDTLAGPEGGFTGPDGEAQINPDEDLYLAQVVPQGKDGTSVGGMLKSVDPRNDETYIYKVRFSRGDVGNKPQWTDGRVQFSQWTAAKKEAK